MTNETEPFAEPVEEAIPERAETASPEAPTPLWTSDAALTLGEARRLTSRRGATMIMLLGEVDVGKTTLLAEMWTEFLSHGRLGGCGFAGSTTALAFEERSFGSRIESDARGAETKRTAEEDDGFLHVRVAPDGGGIRELLWADFTGEHFLRIREGRPIDEELPWLGRVDRFLVMIDGALVASPGTGEIANTRTQRLLYALQASQRVAPSSRLALAVAKQDMMVPQTRDAFGDTESELLTLALEIDPTAQVLHLSARPRTGEDPWGLSDVVDWVLSGDRQNLGVHPGQAVPARSMSRFRS